MKKFVALSLISSSLLLGSNSAKADWDFWAVDYSGDPAIGNNIYTCVSQTGTCTKRTTKVFNLNGWQTANSYVDDKNHLVIYAAGNILHSYDLENDNWTDMSTPWTSNYQKVFERKNIKENNDGTIDIGIGSKSITIDDDSIKIGEDQIVKTNADGTIQIGADENDIDITSEGLAIDGDPLITKKANGELHIGKNSWITKEENGRQKVYAKDANGNSIPIDYTNGTKLLINGRDVEQSINNVGALSAALTGLPTVPTDTTLACGLGTGTHGGDFAFSGGCASKVNEKLSINYAASMTMPGQDYAGDFEDKFSARAGFVWKLGKSNKPTQISMKAKEKMEAKIFSLEEKNEKILSKNQKLENTVSTLLARLERLEKVALGESKSKDLATIKLP